MPLFIRVCIKQSKTGAYLFVGKTGTELCPVAALPDYLCLRGPGDDPLFRFKYGKPYTHARLVHVVALRIPVKKAGINQEDYCSYRFRIGAAMTAAEKGIEDSIIKALGQWKSLAYQQYVRIPTERLVNWFFSRTGLTVET